MTDLPDLLAKITQRFSSYIEDSYVAFNELTVEVKREHILDICKALHEDADFDFKLLADVCGVDYLQYGKADWETESTTESGFSRGVTAEKLIEAPGKRARFAVVYHLL